MSKKSAWSHIWSAVGASAETIETNAKGVSLASKPAWRGINASVTSWATAQIDEAIEEMRTISAKKAADPEYAMAFDEFMKAMDD